MTFNHGVRSSTLRWITKKTSKLCLDVFLFKPTKEAWDGINARCALYGITRQRAWNQPLGCISVGLIPYATSSQFHAAINCGFHTRLRRDLDEKGKVWQKIYCLNIQKAQLAKLQSFVKIIKWMPMLYIKSRSHLPAFLPIFPRLNILKVLRTCYQNLRLHEKSVPKQKVG